MPTSTWTRNGSASWRTQYGWRSDNSYVYQGEWGGWGVHRGFWFFNDSNIRSTLSGQRINRVRIYCSRRSGGSSSSQTVYFHAHNHSSQPSGTPSVGTSAATSGFAVGTGKWVTLPNWVGERLRDGTARGISIYHGSTYVVMNTSATLEIVYEPLLTAPSTPSNFRVTSTDTQNINLAWNSVSTADHYRLDREGGGNITLTGTSYTATILGPNETDRFRVRAENAAGNSSYTGWVRGTTNPTTPTNFRVTGVTSDSVSFAWDAVPGNALEQYRVQRRPVGETEIDRTWTWSPRTSGSNTGGVDSNTRYEYRIRAENAGGNSSYSGWIQALTLPDTPTSFWAEPSHSSVFLSWIESGTFRIRRGTTVIASGISGNSYTDTGLNSLTKYTYSIEAYNDSGGSGYTSGFSVRTTSAKAIRIHTMPPIDPVVVYPSGVEYTLNGDIETAFRITNSLTLSGTEAENNANLPYVVGLRGQLTADGVDGAGIIVKLVDGEKRFYLTGTDEGDIPLHDRAIALDVWYRAKLRLVGRQIHGKVWPWTWNEPDWTSSTTTATEPGYAWIGCAGAVGGVTTDSRYEWDSFSLQNLTGTFNIDLLGDLFIGAPTFDDANFRVAADGAFSIGGDSEELAPFKVSADGTELITHAITANDRITADRGITSNGRIEISDGGLRMLTLSGATHNIWLGGSSATDSPGHIGMHNNMITMYSRGTYGGEGFKVRGSETTSYNDLFVVETSGRVATANVVDAGTHLRAGSGIYANGVTTASTVALGSAAGSAGLAYLAGGYLAISRSQDPALHLNRLNSNGEILLWRRGGNEVAAVSTTTTTVTYGTGSDYRMKEDITEIEDATEKLLALRPIRFKWKPEYDPDEASTDGFLAHEVQEVLPYAVQGEKDAVRANGNIIRQQMDPSKLVPVLTAALQDALRRIEYLELALEQKDGV